MSDDRFDSELDELLAPLKQTTPNGRQMARWLTGIPVVRSSRPRSTWMWAAQLAVAIGVGFAMGAWFFKAKSDVAAVADNFDTGATIEVVYVKGY